MIQFRALEGSKWQYSKHGKKSAMSLKILFILWLDYNQKNFFFVHRQHLWPGSYIINVTSLTQAAYMNLIHFVLSLYSVSLLLHSYTPVSMFNLNFTWLCFAAVDWPIGAEWSGQCYLRGRYMRVVHVLLGGSVNSNWCEFHSRRYLLALL